MLEMFRFHKYKLGIKALAAYKEMSGPLIIALPFFAVVTTYIASVVKTKRVAGNS